MLNFDEFKQSIALSEKLSYIEESFQLLTESADAMGKYHEVMYAWHSNGGKFAKDDPRAKAAEETKKKCEGILHPDVSKAINDKAKKSADEVNGMMSFHGHKHVGAYWTSQPGDIGRVTGINYSQHENAGDVVHRIEDEHGNIRHLSISLKHLGGGSGHAPTSNPGIGQLDKMLGTDSKPHLDKADKEIDKQFPQHAGKSMKAKKEAAKADKGYYDASFEIKRKAVEQIRNHHIAAFNKMPHDRQVSHLRDLIHAHDTPDVPQLVVTSHATGTRIENRAQRYHPSNISRVHTEPAGWNSTRHTIHFKDGSTEQWQSRGKFESGPHSTLKGSFERLK